MVFSGEGKAELESLIKSGIVPANDIADISKVIYKPSFARLCRYLVAINDRKASRDIDPRDAYNLAMTELLITMQKLVKLTIKSKK